MNTLHLVTYLVIFNSTHSYIRSSSTNGNLFGIDRTCCTCRRFANPNVEEQGPFHLMKLPYEMNALEPHISEETIRYHYLKHHLGYVKKLNELLSFDTNLCNCKLEDIIKTSEGLVNDMASQVWNHDFYWLGLTSKPTLEPQKMTKKLIDEAYGSFENFKAEVTRLALGRIGSGWVWLLFEKEKPRLRLLVTKDTENPLKSESGKPVLVLDIWEHAYYVDYRNDRKSYVQAWFNKVDWGRVEELINSD